MNKWKIAAYIRVSRDSEYSDSDTIDNQLSLIKIYCSNNNLNIVETYIDNGLIIDWMVRADKVLELSYLVEPYVFDKEKNIYVWSKFGMYYIENYFDDDTIMKNTTSQVYPNSWSNEYSTVLEKKKEFVFRNEK